MVSKMHFNGEVYTYAYKGKAILWVKDGKGNKVVDKRLWKVIMINMLTLFEDYYLGDAV